MKLKIIKDILLRTDLSATELRVACLIAIETIGDTGKCHISTQNLERTLRIHHSTVVRAKNSLHQKKVVAVSSDRKLGATTHLASSYQFFLPKEGVRPRTQLQRSAAPSLGAATHLEPKVNNPATQKWLAEHQAKHDQARTIVAQKSDDAQAFQQWKRSAWRKQ